MNTGQGKWLLFLFSLAVLTVWIFVWTLRRESLAEDIFLQIEYGELKQNIRGWQDEDGDTLCFFLPSAVNRVTWRIRGNAEFELDGVKIEDGAECRIEPGIKRRISEKKGFLGVIKKKELVILQSENLASAWLVTDTGRMDYVLEEKGNKEGGFVCLTGVDGQIDYAGNFKEIKGHGNYTWLLDKKSFSLNFSQPVELLSLAQDSEWVLMASSSEETHLINRMVFEMMRSAGISDVPNSTWIDLYLNGEYAGNYLLSQKVKPQAQDLNGGWMLEFDGYWEEEGKPGFYTEAGEILAIAYPQKEREGASEEKHREIIDFVQRVENAILNGDGIDEKTGLSWQELVEADSLIKKYILDEISKCPDGWNGSNYCFFRDGKMYFGAPWDYEFAFGNEPAWFSSLQLPQGFYHRYETKWYKALYEKPEFSEAVKAQYRDFFEPYLRKQAKSVLDEQARNIKASMAMDAVRWGREEERFERKLENLKNFISDRLDWLNQEWLGVSRQEETPWYALYLMDGETEYAVHYYRKGSFVDAEILLRDDDGFTGWYEDQACTGLADVLSEPVDGDIRLYSGWEPSAARIRMFVHFLPLMIFAAVFLFLVGFMCHAYRKDR